MATRVSTIVGSYPTMYPRNSDGGYYYKDVNYAVYHTKHIGQTMTIDDAIKNLQDAKESGVKNIILAWWDAGMFHRPDDESWAHDAELVDRKMDWSMTHQDIDSLLQEIAHSQ